MGPMGMSAEFGACDCEEMPWIPECLGLAAGHAQEGALHCEAALLQRPRKRRPGIEKVKEDYLAEVAKAMQV